MHKHQNIELKTTNKNCEILNNSHEFFAILLPLSLRELYNANSHSILHSVMV